MESKTLHEICLALNVTRRMVQGYEKAGLVCASSKNKYGHLLYDEKTCKRIAQIRWLQRIGFKLKEIKDMIDAPKNVMKTALEKQLLQLHQEKEEIETCIQKASELIHDLNS